MRTMNLVLALGATMVVALSVTATAQPGGQQSSQVQQELQMAMENMAKVMLDMPMEERPKYMMEKQQQAVERGQTLFADASLGRNGRTCDSCHPGGGTTGGEAEIPMQGRFPMNPQLPIPTLVGAAAGFPKYKVPNDAVITLEGMNNNCIKMFMMGDGLDLSSQPARDLATFVGTLSNGEEVAIGRMEMMRR